MIFECYFFIYFWYSIYFFVFYEGGGGLFFFIFNINKLLFISRFFFNLRISIIYVRILLNYKYYV